MTFIDWLRTKFSGGAVPLSGAELHAYADEYAALSGDVYIREMALWSAINLVANAISKCEFKTFVNGEETKGREWYLWNIEPNKNQNSSAFIREWIAKLMFTTSADRQIKRRAADRGYLSTKNSPIQRRFSGVRSGILFEAV